MIGALLVLGGLYAAGHFLTGDRVARGVSVAGVDIGGMSGAEAEDKLRDELVPNLNEPIRVQHRSKSYRVTPAKAGLSVDVAETASVAGVRRTFNPLEMIDRLTGDSEVDPVIAVDERALDTVVDRLSKKVHRPAVEGNITFEGGKPEPTDPQPGRRDRKSVV